MAINIGDNKVPIKELIGLENEEKNGKKNVSKLLTYLHLVQS